MLGSHSKKRRNKALKMASEYCCDLLRDDIAEVKEFANPTEMKYNFEDDALTVDGVMNFSESSNVYLKNSAILSLLLAAGEDADFFHPRFCVFDNIEDKGMQQVRSHKFQELVVKYATETTLRTQVIFTTSEMNPVLELDEYVIGPNYKPPLYALEFDYDGLSQEGGR